MHPRRNVAAREAYTALRKGIVANMYKEYQRTAYVWEQYDVEAGTLGTAPYKCCFFGGFKHPKAAQRDRIICTHF
jgi:hypothetical protein